MKNEQREKTLLGIINSPCHCASCLANREFLKIAAKLSEIDKGWMEMFLVSCIDREEMLKEQIVESPMDFDSVHPNTHLQSAVNILRQLNTFFVEGTAPTNAFGFMIESGMSRDIAEFCEATKNYPLLIMYEVK